MSQIRVEVFVDRDAVRGWVMAWNAETGREPITLRRALERFVSWSNGMANGTPRAKHVNARGVRIVLVTHLADTVSATPKKRTQHRKTREQLRILLCGVLDQELDGVTLEDPCGSASGATRTLLEQAELARRSNEP